MSVVYLLHFTKPYYHARHYLGTAEDLPKRLARHLSGDGSRLLRAIQEHGIGWVVVRTWPGSRAVEKRLKRQKHSARYCPICCGQKRSERRAASGV